MPRCRAFLALLLAVTWCTAVWHVDLEAVGMISEHQHHAHGDHDADHAPDGAHNEHEQVVARDVAKDHVRILPAATVASFLVVAFATWLVAAGRPSVAALRVLGRRRETDPPLARAWQFARRCAPASAAPPALG